MIHRAFQAREGGAARAVAARAISILASFLLTIVVARLLGVEAAGSYFLVFTTLAVVATFGRFGTDNLALKICGGNSSNVRLELGYSAAIAAIASVVGIVLIFLGVHAAGFSLPGFDAAWTLAVLAAVIPQVFAVLAGAVLRGRGHLAMGIIAELGSIPVLSIAILWALSLFGTLDVTAALLSVAVASWLTAMWAVPAAIVVLRGEATPLAASDMGGFLGFVRSRSRQLTSMMGTSLLFYVLTWSPLYALSFMSSLANVSYFTTAARLANLVSLIPSLQVAYLAPSFARFFHRGDLVSLNAMCRRAVRQAGALLLLPVAVLSIGAVPAVSLLYGSEFEPAAGPLAVLAVGALVVALAGQVNQLMLLCDLESQALLLNVLLVFLWATLGLWVAAQFGAIGVAWFSAAINALYAVSAAWLLRARRGIHSYLALSLRRVGQKGTSGLST